MKLQQSQNELNTKDTQDIFKKMMIIKTNLYPHRRL
jgi:hypothetical protein